MDIKHRVNSPEWWDGMRDKYIARGDFRDRVNEYSIAADQITSGPVLEVGPAFGMFSRYIPLEVQYLGLEISPELTAECRKRNSQRLFATGNVLNLGHQWKKAFAYTAAFQVLEHFSWSDFDKIMQNLISVTKYGILFSVPKGIPSKADEEADGHLIGWKDQQEMGQYLSKWGKVLWFEGDDNHLFGELVLED